MLPLFSGPSENSIFHILVRKHIMKSSMKAGLGFGVIMGIFYIVSDYIIREPDTIWAGVLTGIIGGAIAGLLFGWITGLFTKKVKRSLQPIFEAGEVLVLETNANHFKGIEAVGGKLFLTNKRLLFQSHSFNIQNHSLNILLNQIKGTERFKTMGLVNNGLKILTDRSIEKFVVEEINQWQACLAQYNNAKQHAL
jgi:hypothetical protein